MSLTPGEEMKLSKNEIQKFCYDCTEKKCPIKYKYSKIDKCKYINEDKAIEFWLQPIVVEDEDD